MQANIYQAAANGTAVYPGQGEALGLIYVALGLNGEAGEVAEVVKKMWRDDNGALTSEVRQKVKKELGDVLWYVAQVATEANLTLTEVMQANLAKLADRKERGVMGGSGDDR